MIFSDETLGAYVDDELDAPQRAEVAAAMAADPEIARCVDRLRAVQKELRTAFSGTAQEPVPQRLLDTVGKPHLRPLKRLLQSQWNWPELGAIAATLLVTSVAGYFLLRSSHTDIVMHQQGTLLARGALAEALSTQLASEQSRAATVRIGISFRDKQGEYCRTFGVQDSRHLAGLACRQSNGWRVQALVQSESPIGGVGAEPAGSALPATVLRAVEGRIAGNPLDAAGEAAARRLNWGAH